ncbi:RluA family pseudouridine synthase [Chloroflexota bacterium]
MSDILVYSADISGDRLDKYLTGQMPQLSRTHMQKLIREGNIRVNDAAAKPSYILDEGDRITVKIPPPPSSPLEPLAMDLHILYEDDDVLVVDKPPGLPVHPALGQGGKTLINAVIAHYPKIGELSESLRPGIVHRLDKDTSGAMVIAKNSGAYLDLVRQFKERRVHKIYLALVKGKVVPEKGIVEANIGRDPRNRQRMAVVSGGRSAVSEFQVKQYLEGYTLLEIKLHTGRTHQIRVHFSAIGHPLVGDSSYGVRSMHLSRQFLHAYRLGFYLPSSSEYREFVSELPADLTTALAEFA